MSALTPPDTGLGQNVTQAPRVTVADHEGVMCARFPRSKVDGVAVRELYEAAMVLTAQPHPRLVVDLTGVPLATSGLMGILVQVHKRFLQAGGRVAIAVPDARVRGSFEVAKLHQLLHLYGGLDEARQGLLA